MNIQLGLDLFVPDISGALWHEPSESLIVADLHLEKASFFAAHGQMLPPYDTDETLLKLAIAIRKYCPKRLICLGDSFHDVAAVERLSKSAIATIISIAEKLELIWITGNHDPKIMEHISGLRASKFSLGNSLLQHEPVNIDLSGHHICGHLHPVAKIKIPRGKTRRRCFVSDGRQLILPAFGALTGGLNICDKAFAKLFEERSVTAFVLGIHRVYAI